MKKEELLLEEYKKAQDSGEHFEKLLWYASSIFLSGLIILIGLIMKAPLRISKIAGSFIGIYAVICLYLFVRSLAYNKNIKFYRCKQIEVELGMKQHLYTDSFYKKHNRLKRPKKPRINKGTTIFGSLLFIIFLFFVGLIYLAFTS